MQTSKAALVKIAEFEGVCLKAYRCPAGVLTIGVGHTGPDVREGMTITRDQAMELFARDIRKFEDYVTAIGLTLNQGQFDALVSFTFNCGPKNLAKLISGRDYRQIADAMLMYNKAKVKGVSQALPGLTRRRQWEHDLFLSGGITEAQAPKNGNPYKEPTTLVRRGNKGNDVRWCQYMLNRHGYALIVDGIFGDRTEAAVIHFQKRRNLQPDAIVGPLTRASLKG